MERPWLAVARTMPILLALLSLPLPSAAAGGSPDGALFLPDPQPIRLAAGDVVPGAVTTTVVDLPATFRSAGSAPIRFRIEPVGDVRLFGPADGTLSVVGDEDPVLLVTFSVPRGMLAGPAVLARVSLEAGSGEQWSGEIDARVVADARIDLALQAPEGDVAAGETRDIVYSVTNLGNAADTVVVELENGSGWSTEGAPTPHPILPGQKISGAMRVRAPSDAMAGDQLLVPFIARGRNAVARAQLMVGIAIPTQSANYHLPVRVFTGASRGVREGSALTASWSVSGSGEVHDGTTLAIDAHSPYIPGGGSVFTRELTGPTFRATLERERWQVTAGDIYQSDDPVTGAYLNGSGASGTWQAGPLRASATLAETNIEGLSSGQVANAGLSLGTALGEFGLAVRGEERMPSLGIGGASLHGGAVSFRGGAPATLRARASAGLVRVSGSAGTSLSPTGFLDLYHSSDRGYLTLRARRMAPEAAAFGARNSELFAGGTVELGGGLAATGWYADDVLGSRLPGTAGRTQAASAGVRYGVGSVQATVRGTSRVTEASGFGQESGRRSSAAMDLSTAIGGAFATLTAEHEIGHRSPLLDYLQGSVQWQTGRSWTSITGTYSARAETDPIVRLDLVQTLQYGATRIDLAAGGTPTASGSARLSGWARTETDVGSGVSVVLGAEYFPMTDAGSPLRLSLGFSRTLSLGLPTRRTAPVTGIAFHDLDNDGSRGANEPGYAGLMLRRGRASVVTNSAGAFELAGPADAQVTVDAGSLLGGLIVPAGHLANPGRGMQIPVVQSAGLTLDLFLDSNGNGARESAEAAVAGAVVTLIHSSGTSYSESTDAQGRIEFKAMPPGAYVARVAAGTARHAAEIELRIAGGGHVQRLLPLRPISREVRFGAAPPAD